MCIDELNKGGMLVLVDPDIKFKIPPGELAKLFSNAGVRAILVGGSTYGEVNFDEFVREIRTHASVPIIIFPGNAMHVSQYADAILFTSLISGRNPQFLIEEQVRAAPIIKKLGIEVIPTGYLLVDGGSFTSVLYKSHTLPIPREKYELAKYHALAAQYLGMKFVYFDTGSGAKLTVPDEMIRSVKEYISIPLIVGGGITTKEEAKKKFESGAHLIVVGSAIEREPDRVYEFVESYREIKE